MYVDDDAGDRTPEKPLVRVTAMAWNLWEPAFAHGDALEDG